METIADLLIWAADNAPTELRGETLEIIRNIVEAVQELFESKDMDIVYEMCPWFVELEHIYVYYFGQSDDIPLA